jgi:1-acyl-sn-glycerol-3-phosphate acyltransferase
MHRIPLGRRIWAPVLRFLIWLFMRVDVHGSELVPPEGAGLVYYNHIHWLDPPIICGVFPRYAVPLTKIEASRFPIVGRLLRWYGVVFITRGAADRQAIQATWDLLDAGAVSVISPEGHRAEDARLQAAKEGLAFIARHNPDCWLMPAAVQGTQAFDFHHIWRRPRIHITYGRPFRFCWPEGRASRETLHEMTDEAMTQFLALLPPAMHGDYAGRDPNQVHWLEFLSA